MTRVLIVEDQALFADVIRQSLLDLGMDVAPPCLTGTQALEAVPRVQPDIVLLDLGLPDQSGLVVGREIRRLRPEALVVALTAMDDARSVREALRAGFHGYLTKDVSVAAFVRSIQSIIDGQVVVPQRASSAMAGGGPQTDDDLLFSRLTERERQVLELLVEGCSGAAIARRLSVSPHTVRTHVQSILMKLQVHSRLEAVAVAFRHGMGTTPPPPSPAGSVA